MFIRFNVTNFLSFNEETEFNMLVGSFRNHEHHIQNLGKLKVLKAAAIYGANGAGKSNLIKAIDLLQTCVQEGEIPKHLNSKKFKLNKDNINLPTSFEVEISIKKKIYSYGISFNNNRIEEEWLYESGIKTDDKMIFERKLKNGKTKINVTSKNLKTQKSKLLIKLLEENLLKDNQLLLSYDEQLKINDIKSVRNWFIESLVILYPNSRFGGLAFGIYNSENFKNFSNELLSTFNTGVERLDIESIDVDKYFGEDDEELKSEIIEQLDEDHYVSISVRSNSEIILVVKENDKFFVKKVISIHKDNSGNDVNFELTEESEGTQRLLDFIPAFNSILNSEKVYFIDEIDQSLHPVLLYSLIAKIMNEEETKGQFIFTTHESNLLDFKIFRQDEIWFAEKNTHKNSTELYPLSEFKPRNDLDIRKGYLNGRFGAIPFTARLEDLNWNV